MELFEIDPELFVSCRLCLDEKGIYQIIPSVKDQIKYCFDINVEQYDGLPQLLCKKCKGVLSEFYETKKRYKEKQDKLIETKAPKVLSETKSEEEKNTDETKDENDVAQKDMNKTTNAIKMKKKKKGKRRILSFSSSSSYEELQSKVNDQETKPDLYKVPTKTFKQSNYQKLFVCRYCNLKYESKQEFLIHKHSHTRLVSQCNVITKHCKVTLQTYDEKPSFTMQDNIVALGEDHFLQDDNSLDYYIIYTTQNAVTENEKMINNTNIAHQKHKLYECSEVVSSDEEYTGKSIPRKRIRLVSPSSPVSSSVGAEESKHSGIDHISDNDIKKDLKLATKSDDIACINIDDNSTDASGEMPNVPTSENDKGANQKVKVKIPSDYKTITNIISISYNKHLKKMETSNSSKEQQDKKKDAQNEKLLNRKLLSIGRKVMSKAGLISMSLLKHLQQKDLKITWVTKRFSGPMKHAYPLGKEADYIRIQTKIQSVEENNLTGFQIFNISNDDFEYNNILPVPILNMSDPKNMLKRISMPVDTVPNLTCKRDPILGPIIEADAQCPNMSQRRPEEVIQSTSIVKSSETQENYTVLSQLLNANPVANPKQVPKKKTPLELNADKTVTDKVQISKTLDHDYEAFICLDSDEEQTTTEPRLMMPIITSTTSLVNNAKVKVNEQSKPNIVSEQKNETVIKTVVTQDKLIPRIKCKPVSELMATNTNNNLQQNMVFIQDPVNQQQTQPFPALAVTLAPNAMVNVPFQMPPSINDNASVLLQSKSTEIANQSKMINANRSVTFLMHCPTLPNTLTTSPFLYIRQLMSYHKINFMEVNKKLNKEFICLIKFKLSVRQEVRSILLYLSLHGHGRDFCLKVRDKNNECINVETRPAFWEWEVLKAFQDDTVTSKTLDCVERFDSEFYKVTKLFLGLLKTVECRDTK